MRKGFSLLEGLIITAVVIILASISINGILGWIHRNTVRTTAQELLADLEWARSLAYKKGSSKIVFGETGYLIYAPADSDKPLLEKSTPPQIKITPTKNLAGKLEFKRNKLPTQSGSITIEGYGIIYKITINNTSGRIYLEQGP